VQARPDILAAAGRLTIGAVWRLDNSSQPALKMSSAAGVVVVMTWTGINKSAQGRHRHTRSMQRPHRDQQRFHFHDFPSVYRSLCFPYCGCRLSLRGRGSTCTLGLPSAEFIRHEYRIKPALVDSPKAGRCRLGYFIAHLLRSFGMPLVPTAKSARSPALGAAL
jgi:hypothetical protein